MIDISLLRVLSTRDAFEKLQSAIPKAALDARTRVLVEDITRYYKAFTDHTEIDFVQFRDVFKLWHPKLKEEELAFYDKILLNAEKNLDEISHSVLMNSLLELDYASKIAELLELYNSGEEINLVEEIAMAQERIKILLERADTDNWIEPDLDDLMASEEDSGKGLEWRLPSMNAALRPLIPGDAMIIAGRPGKGKTTFVTDAVTHMAPQIDNRPVLWLNNEGDGRRIVKRLMQSALDKTMSELVTLNNAKTLKKLYADLVGSYDRIKVLDIHGYYNWQVAKIIEQHNPKLVVMDMIDNIKFAGLSLKGGARTDQILEEMYKWGRELSVKEQFSLIATSQISYDGDGLQFPTEGMLKDSKTGKQGATDTILMIGSTNDPTQQKIRYLSTPKEKFAREGADPLMQEVLFDKDRGRYREY